jgi:predicted nucleotide-binding protein (sugar kinase/HSP70/actin superfamily)
MLAHVHSTAPYFRSYFEVLGLDPRNVIFSDETTEEMWSEGGKYGSVDPCFPAKVVQAHFHQLLFHSHKERPLDVIFFPILTHVPSFVKHAVDYTSCPIVAGTPDVIKAAFTKEQDFFSARGIRYLDPTFSFSEPVRMKRRLFEVFGELLGVTEDESDFAVDEGLRALERFDLDVQARGRAMLEQVEAEDRLAILLIGRPYHLDPGLHHGIPDEFQMQGYPILTIRSIPKDEAWLSRFFARDLESGRIKSPLDINDVWPENYSANSAMKVWAAKFAARHPNVVLLDLSSFKCGHDAPTYGIVDRIVEQSALPHLGLHDIDANKPGGSIKIRVKTYVHSLKLHQERLEDVARKKAELAQRLDEKRLELLRMQQASVAAQRGRDTQLQAQIDALTEKVAAYKSTAAPVEVAKSSGLVQLGKKRGSGEVVRL